MHSTIPSMKIYRWKVILVVLVFDIHFVLAVFEVLVLVILVITKWKEMVNLRKSQTYLIAYMYSYYWKIMLILCITSGFGTRYLVKFVWFFFHSRKMELETLFKLEYNNYNLQKQWEPILSPTIFNFIRTCENKIMEYIFGSSELVLAGGTSSSSKRNDFHDIPIFNLTLHQMQLLKVCAL